MQDDVADSGAADVPERGRPVPGGRTKCWIVSAQPRAARPASCRGCHQCFDEGEVRICTQGDRQRSRWIHPECMVGGLRRGMIFTPDCIDDAISARSLTERVAHDASIAPAEGSVIGSLEPCGFEPPRVDQPLPGLSFFRSLEWSDLRRLPGDTYV